MLSEQKISNLLGEIQKRLKDSGGKRQGFNPVYDECVKHMEAIKVHSDLDSDISRLVKKKFPSETDEEFKYRIDNYEPVTVPFWNLALGRLQRIWNETNYDIAIENDNTTAPAQSYLFGQYPFYQSITGFFKSIVTKAKINDPNGLLVVRPYQIPQTENEDGEIVADTGERIQPVAFIYHSDRVIDYVNGQYAIVELMERSEVESNGKKVREGVILEIYDDTYIYRVMQTGRKIDYKFSEAEVYYQHNWQRLPAWKLRGLPKQREIREFFESYYSPALPNLNTATILNSTLSGTENKCAYPIRSRIYQECDEPGCGQGCPKGMIIHPETGESQCPACRGSGIKGNPSPFADILVNTDDSFQNQPPFPGIAYTAPSTDILNYLDDKVVRLIITGFSFINIAITEKPEGKTATEVKINMEDLYSFLLQISEEVFDLLQNTMDAIIFMRYPGESIEAKIARPDEFEIRSSAELTEELSQAKTAGVPTPATQKILTEFMARRFSSDEIATRKLEIQSKVDRFIDMSQQDFAIGLANRSIQLWHKYLHDGFWLYLTQEIEADENFLFADMAVIREALEARAKADASTGAPQATAAAIVELANGV